MLYLCTSKMLLLTFILKFKSSYFCILMEHEVFVLERKREINQKDLIRKTFIKQTYNVTETVAHLFL